MKGSMNSILWKITTSTAIIQEQFQKGEVCSRGQNYYIILKGWLNMSRNRNAKKRTNSGKKKSTLTSSCVSNILLDSLQNAGVET